MNGYTHESERDGEHVEYLRDVAEALADAFRAAVGRALAAWPGVPMEPTPP